MDMKRQIFARYMEISAGDATRMLVHRNQAIGPGAKPERAETIFQYTVCTQLTLFV